MINYLVPFTIGSLAYLRACRSRAGEPAGPHRQPPEHLTVAVRLHPERGLVLPHDMVPLLGVEHGAPDRWDAGVEGGSRLAAEIADRLEGLL